MKTPLPHGPISEPVEIHLESNDLVLRGLTGEATESAILIGEVIVNLFEQTTLKEIQLVFTGTAKIVWRDLSNHHYVHPIYHHEFLMLNPSSASSSSKSTHSHSHTLSTGRHVFPFSLTLPGTLPASIATASNSAICEYRLKAIVSRPGFAASDWKARSYVRVSRGFGTDAIEYNQTLEIENTWPNKVMYAFCIPHKAYAAGDTIPVSVKFSPLAKGVRIVSLTTVIKEQSIIHSKNSSHSESRDATVVKSVFRTPERSVIGTRSRSGSTRATVLSSLAPSTTNSIIVPDYSDNHTNAVASGSGTRPSPQHNAIEGQSSSSNQDGNENDDEEQEEYDDGIATEVDVVIDIPIPFHTCPTHSVHPILINHKIKWSAFIRNPDGHVSELRCALPIHILAPSLSAEAGLASAGARNLLFGESGVLAISDIPQVDLPSFEDHVKDRVANAETASNGYFSISSGFAHTPWSGRSTPAQTPGSSPPGSPAFESAPAPRFAGLGGQSRGSYQQKPYNHAGSSGSVTPLTPASPGPAVAYGYDEQHPEDHRNWIDSELMGTLNLEPGMMTPAETPGSSPSASRSGSRVGSRVGSPVEREAGSHFPHASTSGHGSAGSSFTTTPAFNSNGHLNQDSTQPHFLSNRSATSTSFFHNMHLPNPLRPLTAFSRNASSSSVAALTSSSASSTPHSPAQFLPSSTSTAPPSASALSHALAAHQQRSGAGSETVSPTTHTHIAVSNVGGSGNTSRSNSIAGSPIATTAHYPRSPPGLNHHHSTGHGLCSSGTSGIGIGVTPLTTTMRRRDSTPLHTTLNQFNSVAAPPSLALEDGTATGSRMGTGTGQVDFLSQVPSYDVASRGFLGGGVVPLSTLPPPYLEEGTRSNTN